MKKYFSIGETAKINNVSVQALRLYDKMGLLKPAYVDPDTNYRYYTMDQFMYIDLIKYAKDIGAPLKELGYVLHNKDSVTLLSFLKKKQKEIEKEIIRLNNVNKVMGHIEDNIRYALELKENIICYRELKKRLIIDTPINKKDDAIDIEIKIRKIDRIMEQNNIMFEGESGCFIDLDIFSNEGEMFYKSVYSTVWGEDIENKNVDIREIPDGKYICIAYLNKERSMAVDKLRKYIKENNIKPLGIAVETQLLNMQEKWDNDFVYELQILI